MADKQIITIGYYTETELSPDYYDKVMTTIRTKGTFDKRMIRSNNVDTINNIITHSSVVYVILGKKQLPNTDMIAYCEVHGTKWTVVSVEYEYPELVLTLGGVYNGTD